MPLQFISFNPANSKVVKKTLDANQSASRNVDLCSNVRLKFDTWYSRGSLDGAKSPNMVATTMQVVVF